MRSAYTIHFPARHENAYRWMGRFILLGSTALFVTHTHPIDLKAGWPIAGILLLLLDLLAGKKGKGPRALLAGISIQSMAWAFSAEWLIAVLLLILGALHRLAVRKKILLIEVSGIRYSFPWPHQRNWSEIEFIILKDQLLTIENKNGRVLQQIIEKDPSLSEANFNEFCQQQCNT